MTVNLYLPKYVVAQVTYEDLGKITCGVYALPTNVGIVGSEDDDDGLHALVYFGGAGLEEWAQLAPIVATFSVSSGVIVLTAVA
jgi:hypothetical protein